MSSFLTPKSEVLVVSTSNFFPTGKIPAGNFNREQNSVKLHAGDQSGEINEVKAVSKRGRKRKQPVEMADVNDTVHTVEMSDSLFDPNKSSYGQSQECTICSMTFSSKRSFLKHMLIHENDREFKCNWCKLSYNYEVNLLVHIAMIHTEECSENEDNKEISYKCPICVITFSRKKALQGHCLVHQTDEELVCEHCSSSFKSKILLGQHLDETDNGNLCKNKMTVNYLRCKTCFKLFDCVGNIKKHYAQFHPKGDNEWLASNNNNNNNSSFSKLSNYNEDKQTEEVPVEAPVADPIPETKMKRRKSSAVASQIIKLCAEDERPQDDGNAEYTPARRGRPRKDDPSYQRKKGDTTCPVCLKTFKTPILLRRHEVTHTGIKAFPCPVCGARFSQKSSVKIHMVLHQPEKSHKCPFCIKMFTYEHNMNTHIRVVHQKNQYDRDAIRVPRRMRSRQQYVRNEMGNIQDDTDVRESSFELLENDDDDLEYCWNGSQLEEMSIFELFDQIESSSPVLKSKVKTTSIAPLSTEVVEVIDEETGQTHMQEQAQIPQNFTVGKLRPIYRLSELKKNIVKNIANRIIRFNFRCYICRKSFRNKSFLQNHLKCHEKLRERLNIHDGLKDLKSTASSIKKKSCNFCQKHFPTIKLLQQHIRFHHLNQGKYLCIKCYASFKTKSALIRHELVHSDLKPYACPLCYRRFNLKEACDNHVEKQVCIENKNSAETSSESSESSEDGVINKPQKPEIKDESVVHQQTPSTPIDDQKYVRVDNYATTPKSQKSSHKLLSKTTNNPSLVDKFPLLKASLFSDEDSVAPNSSFYSSQSASKSILNSTFYNSNNIEPPKYYHGCAKCDQKFRNSQDLISHVKSLHEIDKEFTCNECNKAFSAELSLWAHSKTHEMLPTGTMLTCIACGLQFNSVASLSRHVRMQHNDNLNVYKCIHCNELYKTTRELDSHIKQLVSSYDVLMKDSSIIEVRNSITVSNENYPMANENKLVKLNKSEIQEIATMDVSNIERQSIKELVKVAQETTGVIEMKPYPKVAERSLETKYPYNCSICRKGFDRSSNLQQHMSTHSTLKTFRCSKCDKTFKHKCSLKTHEETQHTEVKRLLQCHLCMKLLRNKLALRSHMKLHVNDYSFRCPGCNRDFPSKEQLDRHEKMMNCRSKMENAPGSATNHSSRPQRSTAGKPPKDEAFE